MNFLKETLTPSTLFLLPLCLVTQAEAADVKVSGPTELRAAVASAKPGTRLLLWGGNYGANFHFSNLRGEAGRPIVIMATDTNNPPVFSGGNTGIQLSNPAYVELSSLTFTNLAQNGLNIDDGNATNSPESTKEITLRDLRFAGIGGDGNHDGIKLSGIWDFRVLGTVIDRWGTKGGSAIDMVGCHRGLIESNVIRHVSPEPPNCTGVQGKGGTSDVVIRRNRFENAGGRSVNIGGSTGLQFFRPPLVANQEHAEARNIVVEGNVFVGSSAPIAFVGVDGARVRFNTIVNPSRWAMRILQENKSAGFVACRNGVFSDNAILFQSGHWNEGGVNIGAGVAAETFRFARNWWYCGDQPARSRPRLPSAEEQGVYGRPLTEANGIAGADALKD